MLNYIKRKFQKNKQRRTFREYGFEVKTFRLPADGEVRYAQWQHPFESIKSFGQDEVAFIRQYVKPGDLVIDIGAHTGDSTIPLALAAGPTGTVLAFEPNKYVFKVLAHNATLNTDKTHIVPLNFAATVSDSKLVFNYSDASFCNGGDLSARGNHKHNYPLEVEGRHLQNYLLHNHAALLPRLTFVKVDAEGFDKEIIKNIREIITQYKPTLLSECYRGLSAAERTEFYELLTQMGYKLYLLDGLFSQNMQQITSAAQMSQEKHFDFLALPG